MKANRSKARPVKTLFVAFLLEFVFCYLASAQQVTSGTLSSANQGPSPLNNNDKAVVILIHGWTNKDLDKSPPNQFDDGSNGSWTRLLTALKSKLGGTDWKLALYHWEKSASTGGIIEASLDYWPPQVAILLSGAINAGNAAEHGFSEGANLAALLNQTAPNLRKAVFIAHSAGAWVAYRAADKLLQINPYVIINIVLLDPFIPGAYSSTTALTPSLMGQLASRSYDRIFRCENYYSIDFTDTFLSNSTSQTFTAWNSSRDINKRVDYAPNQLVHLGNYYGPEPVEKIGHAGPLRFYADSIIASTGTSVPDGLAQAPWNFLDYGFYKSLIYQEQIFLPKITVQPPKDTSAIPRSDITLSVTAARATTFDWYKNGSYLGTGTPLVLKDVSASDAGEYVVKVSNSYGAIFSDAANLTITNPPPANAPATPENLKAEAVSSSQINISWTPVLNVGGYRLERATRGGDYFQIADIQGASAQSKSDTSGLSPATDYYYRIRAYNSSGNSKYSNPATAITSSASTGTYSLQVNAIDLEASQILAASISSWTGTSANYQTNTTSFTRTVTKDAKISVSAPATLSSGKTFQYWLLDSATMTYNTVASTTMNGYHNFIAVYGSGGSTGTRTLTGLSISGPSAVDEDNSAQYRATATYSDGSTADVTSGAKWDVSSSYADISSSGVLDADSVSNDKSVEIEVKYTTGGVTKTATKDVTIRNAVSTTTYALTLNATNGSIFKSPKMSSYPAGTEVDLHAHPDDGYKFDHWSGDLSGIDAQQTITMSRDKLITANFVPDTSEGAVTVDIHPQQAASEGAAWKVSGKVSSTNWQPSGDTFPHLPSGAYRITFKDIPGWITPDEIKTNVAGGSAVPLSGTYREVLGAVQTSIEPADAVTAGAKWQIDDGAWQESGATLANVPTGSHTVKFGTVNGWTSPASRTITVSRGQPTILSGNYEPAAGQPLIAAITPNTGALEGGTVVTITGANFQNEAAVSFGGRPVTNVVVKSNGEISAVTPAGVKYGTVAVTVTTGGQTASKAAGFTYDIPLGMSMIQLSQLGGSVRAVAVQGSMVYYGEGNGFVAADFSNPSSPVVRGRIALPGIVNDIKISGQYALVADGQWGLQIVDLSDPVNLQRVGFYDTPGYAGHLDLSGNLAFIADDGGVEIIDFSDKTAPFHAASYAASPYAYDIALTTIEGRRIACVACEYAGVRVLDMTDTANVSQLSLLEAGKYQSNITLNQNTLILAGDGNGQSAKVLYDLSDPAHPRKLGSSVLSPSAPALATNTYFFVGSGDLHVEKMSDILNPPGEISTYDLALAGSTYEMILSGSTLFMANGSGGLIAVNIVNPAAPVVRSTLNNGFSASDVKIGGTQVYLAARSANGDLSVINNADPRKPQVQGTMNSSQNINHIQPVGTNIYTATGRTTGSPVISVQNPQQPVQVSLPCTDRKTQDVALLNGNAIIGGATKSTPSYPLLTALNGSNPTNTTPASSFQLSNTPGTVATVAANGNTTFAFIGWGNDAYSLKIVDYTNVTSPQIVGSLDESGGIPIRADVSSDGHYAYLADTSGLRIFDCGNRSAPVLLTTYARNGISGQAVAVQGSLVFYTDSRGLNVLDCSDPANPKLVAAYDTPGTPTGVFADGKTIYVADGDAGLQILELGDVGKPTVEIVQPTRNSQFETAASTVALEGMASDAQGIAQVSWQNSRGGGGIATGTTSWKAEGIFLQPGENVVTITATDTNGNLATDTITINATVPDTVAPVVAIIGPMPDEEFTVNAPSVTLSGVAADNTSVTSLIWSNERTGGSGGITMEGEGWSLPDLTLLEGPNKITITATDAAGNEASTNAVIFYVPPDGEPPTVSIDFPTMNSTYETSSGALNLSGESSDDQLVSSITWSNSRGGSGDVSGTSPWWVNAIPLQIGLNVIDITATDGNGNVSTETLSVTYSLAEPPATPTPTPAPPTRPPVRPASVHTTKVVASGGKIRVGISFRQNTPAKRFDIEVRYRLGGKWSPWKIVKGLPARGESSSTYLASLRLKPADVYQIRIIAINDSGKSKSKVITVRAPKTAANQPPSAQSRKQRLVAPAHASSLFASGR